MKVKVIDTYTSVIEIPDEEIMHLMNDLSSSNNYKNIYIEAPGMTKSSLMYDAIVKYLEEHKEEKNANHHSSIQLLL